MPLQALPLQSSRLSCTPSSPFSHVRSFHTHTRVNKERDDEIITIINPCIDWSFKRSIGSIPEAYRVFANAFLGFEGDDALEEFEFINTEMLSISPVGKNFMVDVVARDKKDRFCLIEMQNEFFDYYPDHIRMQHARFESNLDMPFVLEQLPDGNLNKTLLKKNLSKGFENKVRDVHSIVVSNQLMDAEHFPDIINTFELRHKSHPEVGFKASYPSTLTVVTLANFDKPAEALETDLDRCLFFLKDGRLKTSVKHRFPRYRDVPFIEEVYGTPSGPLYQTYNTLRPQNITKADLREFGIQMEEMDVYLRARYARWLQKGHEAGLREAAARLIEDGMSEEEAARVLRISRKECEDSQ